MRFSCANIDDWYVPVEIHYVWKYIFPDDKLNVNADKEQMD